MQKVRENDIRWRPRLAKAEDIPSLEGLIPLSAKILQVPYYSAEQIEAAFGPVFGVDRQLIQDGTYFVVEVEGRIVGCGGWSRRKSRYGGDLGRTEPDLELNPATEPARIRAFFVHPSFARRGIGRAIMEACEEAIAENGFRTIEIIATLAGEPLYASFGYSVVERFEIPLNEKLSLPAVKMQRLQ